MERREEERIMFELVISTLSQHDKYEQSKTWRYVLTEKLHWIPFCRAHHHTASSNSSLFCCPFKCYIWLFHRRQFDSATCVCQKTRCRHKQPHAPSSFISFYLFIYFFTLFRFTNRDNHRDGTTSISSSSKSIDCVNLIRFCILGISTIKILSCA